MLYQLLESDTVAHAAILYVCMSPTSFRSANFGQDELGELVVDIVLEPGDLLYFPRGFTHQVMITKATAQSSCVRVTLQLIFTISCFLIVYLVST